jgi:acyl-CoA thioesterase FadM
MDPIRFVTSHTARFSEIDPNGHLNTKHFFDYIAENRMIGHREVLGLRAGDFARLPFAVVTRSIELDIRRPIYLEEAFKVVTWVDMVAESSATVIAELSLSDGVVAAKAKLTLVSVDKKTARPLAWEKDFINRFFKAGG